MEHATMALAEQNVLAMAITESRLVSRLQETTAPAAYPKTCPTIDMTAHERV